MKYIFYFFISIVSLSSLAGGDNGNNRRIVIDNYESNLNLQYFGLEDSVGYLDSKGKPRWFYASTNIAVYNISKDQVSNIFNDTIKRTIVGFHYETRFIEEFKTIEFNNLYNPNESYSNRGLYDFSNNFDILQRPLSNNLIIVTEDVKEAYTTIWICDKYGNNLKKAFEFTRDWSWEIDVKNQMIRLSRQTGMAMEIKNFKY